MYFLFPHAPRMLACVCPAARLTPVYKELGEQVSSDGKLASRVVIAKVNADEHRGLGERFGIQGFPTIKYFGRGKSVESPEE